MKSPIKLENDWHEHSMAEKIIIITVLFIVAVVMISWAADGFASLGIDVPQAAHGVARDIEYSQGYNTEVKDWDLFNTDKAYHFDCPLSHTAPHSEFCKG